MATFRQIIEGEEKPIKEEEFIGVKDFPFNRQTYDYDCGACALQSVLFYYGFNVREEKIMDIGKTNEKYGTPFSGMKDVLSKYKISFTEKRRMNVDELKGALSNNNPVILCIQAWGTKNADYSKYENGHYVVAIGYKGSTIYFEDPSVDTRAFMDERSLKERWHCYGDNNKEKVIGWGIIVKDRKEFNPKMAKKLE